MRLVRERVLLGTYLSMGCPLRLLSQGDVECRSRIMLLFLLYITIYSIRNTLLRTSLWFAAPCGREAYADLRQSANKATLSFHIILIRTLRALHFFQPPIGPKLLSARQEPPR